MRGSEFRNFAAAEAALRARGMAPIAGGDEYQPLQGDARREALARIQKATIDTGVGAGGLLSPSQSRAFVVTIKDKSPLGARMRLEQRTPATGTINKLSTGTRLIREAAENADDGYRAGATFPTVPYAAKKLRLPWEATEDEFHENLEGEALEAKLMDQMTQQYALDWDDLNVNGDDASGDPFIGIDDGLLVKAAAGLAGSHRINAGAVFPNSFIEKDKLFTALKAMPNKYVNQGGLVWIGSPVNKIAWQEYLTNRATPGGDSALSGGPFADRPLSIEYLSVPSFPDSRIILTNPQNLVRVVTWEIRSRRVTGATDWELATRDKRGYITFLKADFVIEELDAMVDIYNLTVNPV